MKKLLVAPDLYQLTFDRTGIHPENKVTAEQHTLTAALERIMIPVYGAFFVKSMVVRDTINNVTLNKTQFKCIEMVKIATQELGHEIAKFVVVTDPAVSNSITITYQALGGERAYDHYKLAQLVDNELSRVFTVDWNDLKDKPSEFMPGHHLHDAKDLYGMEFIRDALDRIKDAILMDKAPLKDAMRQLAHRKAKTNDDRYAVLFAQSIKAKIRALEAAAGKAPGASGVTAAGSLLLHYCQGTTLMGTYYDGNVGTYTETIAVNSPSCGGVLTPATPRMTLTTNKGFIWPDKQPRTVDTYPTVLPVPDTATLKVPVGTAISARAIFNELIPNTPYTARFATQVKGHTEYLIVASVNFKSDDNGSAVVDQTFPNGLFASNQFSTLQDNRIIVGLNTVSSLSPFTAAAGISNVVSVFTDSSVAPPVDPVSPKTTYSHPTQLNGYPSMAVITQAQAIGSGNPTTINPQASYMLMRAPATGNIPCFSFTVPIDGQYCFITSVMRYANLSNAPHLTAYVNGAVVHTDAVNAQPFYQWMDMHAGDVYELQMVPTNLANGVMSSGLVDLRVLSPDNRLSSVSQDFVTYNGAQRAPWAYFYRDAPGAVSAKNPQGAMLLT